MNFSPSAHQSRLTNKLTNEGNKQTSGFFFLVWFGLVLSFRPVEQQEGDSYLRNDAGCDVGGRGWVASRGGGGVNDASATDVEAERQ